MAFSVVIPARFGSSRLHGKALLDIAGKSMVQHVYEQSCLSDAERVIIATDDERIRSAAQGFGAEVVMTSPDHPSGTDRLQEVVEQLGLPGDYRVVNVQGDEPLIPPALINQVAQNLYANREAGIATLCERIHQASELLDPNVVKVVVGVNGMALYFSRAPIPWPRDQLDADKPQLPEPDGWLRHIGIYAYRAAFLNDFVSWPPAPIEQLEKLEQLRAMFHGVPIHVGLAQADVPPGVDTEEDLETVRRYFLDQAAGLNRL